MLHLNAFACTCRRRVPSAYILWGFCNITADVVRSGTQLIRVIDKSTNLAELVVDDGLTLPVNVLGIEDWRQKL